MKNNNLILIKIFIPCVSVCYFMHALIMLMRCFYTMMTTYNDRQGRRQGILLGGAL